MSTFKKSPHQRLQVFQSVHSETPERQEELFFFFFVSFLLTYHKTAAQRFIDLKSAPPAGFNELLHTTLPRPD